MQHRHVSDRVSTRSVSTCEHRSDTFTKIPTPVKDVNAALLNMHSQKMKKNEFDTKQERLLSANVSKLCCGERVGKKMSSVGYYEQPKNTCAASEPLQAAWCS